MAPEVARQSLLNATACTLAPGLLVMRAIERLGSTLATQNGMIGPISPILTGVLFLDDPFAPGLVAGTLLALSGVRMPARAR